MKKSVLLLALLFCYAVGSYAQDDVYFVPKKTQKKVSVTESKNTDARSSYEVLSSNQENVVYDNEDDWYVGRNTRKDVDAYNRRSTTNNEVTEVEEVPEAEDGQYTTRIIRFHSPGTVVVLSPYYWDFYDDLWYDPWYSWTWRPYSSWAWRTGWYSGWYGGWRYSWYDPWYSWSWNAWAYPRWNHWYGGYYPPYRHNDFAWGRPGHNPAPYRGGWGGRRDYNYASNAPRPGSRSGVSNSRHNNVGNYGGIGTRPNNNGIYNGNSRNRSFGSSGTYNRQVPNANGRSGNVGSGRSRNYNNGGTGSGTSSRGRSWSSSSSNRSSGNSNSRTGSYNSSRSSSGGGRSFGSGSVGGSSRSGGYSGGSVGGGGRSFGGSGGGSRGGRR